MPPVFGPVVAVADPLVVLGRGHRHDRLAVAEREQGELLALEVLLEDDAAARLAEARSRKNPRSASRAGSGVGRDDHSLARRQAVRLQHRGKDAQSICASRLLVGVEDDVRGGRDAGLAA